MPAGGPAPAGSSTSGILNAASPVFDPLPNKDERLFALFIHLGGALGHITSAFGIPGGNLLVPLILWLSKKDTSRFIDDQGKEVLNFQICMFVISVILIMTCIGIVLVYPLGLAALIFGIIGAIKANDGVAYRYPVNFRMIK